MVLCKDHKCHASRCLPDVIICRSFTRLSTTLAVIEGLRGYLLANSLVTSLAPRPMAVVFGLGTRLCVRMRTQLENGILCNRQQPQSVLNGFY